MAENEVQQVQTEQNPAEEQKKLTVVQRIGYILLGVTPIFTILTIQSITQIPFLILASVDIAKNAKALGVTDPMEATRILMEVFNEKYAFYAYLLYTFFGFLVFGLWYFFEFVKKSPKVKAKQIFGVKSLIAVIAAVLSMYFIISAGFILAYQFFPEAMDSYAELMENSGIGSNTLITIIYVIFLGPVLEELCVRGVSYGYIEKSGIGPAFNILITGILFGVMHLNVVQGIYAAFLGFMLAFFRYKYRSIRITIVTHILFNLMGTYGEVLVVNRLIQSEGVHLILGGVALFVIVFVFLLVNSDKKAVHASEGKK